MTQCLIHCRDKHNKTRKDKLKSRQKTLFYSKSHSTVSASTEVYAPVFRQIALTHILIRCNGMKYINLGKEEAKRGAK